MHLRAFVVALALALMATLAAAQGNMSHDALIRTYDHKYRVGDDMWLFWTVEWAPGSNGSANATTTCDDILHFAILVEEQVGWLGIGVAMPAADMPGADIGVANGFSTAGGGATPVFRDYYAIDYDTPAPDDCGPSDWVAIAGFSNATLTAIEGRRAMAARDPVHDRSIQCGDVLPTHLIFAHGPDADLAFHGEHTADVRLNLCAPAGQSPLSPGASEAELAGVENFFIGMSNYSVPTDVTTYVDTDCVPIDPDLLATGAYLIGFKSQLQNSTAHFVHHMVVKGWVQSATCDGNVDMGIDIFGAASDPHTAFFFPSDVALNISSFKAFSVQFHYSNPDGVANITDSSGIAAYFVRAPRTHVAGMVQFADPAVATTPVNLPQGLSRYTYECPSGCTMGFTEDITVIAELAHMHGHGIMMSTQYASSNGSVYFTSATEHYDFHKQVVAPYPRRVTVKRGDVVTTTCTYATDSAGVAWGRATEDEMCIAFVYYYPAQASIVPGTYCGIGGLCGTMTGIATFPNASALGRSWGVDGDCEWAESTNTTLTTDAASSSSPVSTTVVSSSTTLVTDAMTTTLTSEPTTSTTLTSEPTTTLTSEPTTTSTLTSEPTTSTLPTSLNVTNSTAATTTTATVAATTTATTTSLSDTTTGTTTATSLPRTTVTTATTPTTTTARSTATPTTQPTVSATNDPSRPLTITVAPFVAVSTFVASLAARLGVLASQISVQELSSSGGVVTIALGFTGDVVRAASLTQQVLNLANADLLSLGATAAVLAGNAPPMRTLSPNGAPDGSDGLAPGAIAGIVIACVAVVAIIIGLAWWDMKRGAHAGPPPIKFDEYMRHQAASFGGGLDDAHAGEPIELSVAPRRGGAGDGLV